MVKKSIIFFISFFVVSCTLFSQKVDITDTNTLYHNLGTYYHDRFEGRLTANGEIFDQNKFTAAHLTIPLGTMLQVTNRGNGNTIYVVVNDRCPKRGVLDLSHRAAVALGNAGLQHLAIRVLPKGYEERWLAQDSIYDSVPSSMYQHLYAEVKMKKARGKTEEKSVEERDIVVVDTLYNIDFGVVRTHGEAFNIVQCIQEEYRNLISIEETVYGGVHVVLLLGKTQDDAKTIATYMRNRNIDCEIVRKD